MADFFFPPSHVTLVMMCNMSAVKVPASKWFNLGDNDGETMLCNMMPWQSSHVARRCLAPSVYSNSMTAWLNGFWEHGRQPGVIYRHDLIEWNTIHPESVLRTIFLDVTMSGNARCTPIWVMTRKVRSTQRAVYLGTYSKGVKKKL